MDQEKVIILDWQFVTERSPLNDIAYLMGSSMNAEERIQHEEMLIREVELRFATEDFCFAWSMWPFGVGDASHVCIYIYMCVCVCLCIILYVSSLGIILNTVYSHFVHIGLEVGSKSPSHWVPQSDFVCRSIHPGCRCNLTTSHSVPIIWYRSHWFTVNQPSLDSDN